MCGIAGILSREPVPSQQVSNMLDTIRYRGPDAFKVVQIPSPCGRLWLTVGQVRLAIIDPAPESDQPFFSNNESSSLTFNGEFYNFQALRQQLEADGLSFRTKSDTEVALAMLDRHGPDALQELWGMFAGVHFKDGTLTLFRDRLGKKPLYVLPLGKKLYFASEPKAILTVLDRMPQPDLSALSSFFYLGYVPGDQCAFDGMFKLPAGHYLTVDADMEPRVHQWYRPVLPTAVNENDLVDTFVDAVRLRMIADRPLGAFLSGGVDSSLVVAAMSRLATKKINTFCVRFEGPQSFDESPIARATADFYGTDHHEILLDRQRLLHTVPEVLAHFDEPFGDSSAVPTFLISQEARKLFAVALTGDGGDEVFGGYRKYLVEHYLRKLGPYSLRRWLFRPMLSLLPTGRSNRLLELGRRVRRLMQGDAPTAAMRHVRLLRMSPFAPDRLFGHRFRGFSTLQLQDRLLAKLPKNADLNDVLQFDQQLVLQDDMFVKVDRMSMKASLELRSPLVDHRLVELANGLPPERKILGTRQKLVLLERFSELAPTLKQPRPKSGFEMPLGVWLRHELKALAEDLLFHTNGLSQWLDAGAVNEMWARHQSGRRDLTESIWFCMVFTHWLRRYYL